MAVSLNSTTPTSVSGLMNSRAEIIASRTDWMRVPSIEPLTSTTNTVATGRPPSFLSFQTFWTSISVDPDGASTVGV